MALQLVWSPEAIEDIESIAAYIERDSPWYAHAVASRIVATAETIPEHPEMGRVVPEIEQKDIRERFVYNFRVIYRVEKKLHCHSSTNRAASKRWVRGIAIVEVSCRLYPRQPVRRSGKLRARQLRSGETIRGFVR